MITSKNNSKSLKILTGENIQRYFLKGQIQSIIKENVFKNLTEYFKEKIIVRQLGSEISATLDISGCITVQSVYNLYSTDKNILNKFILGVLNSRFTHWVYTNVYAEKQKFPRIILENIRCLTFPKIDIKNPSHKKLHDEIVKSVENLLAINKQKQEDDLTEAHINRINNQIVYYENRINEIVYQLYGLTKEEIKIVENENNSRS